MNEDMKYYKVGKCWLDINDKISSIGELGVVVTEVNGQQVQDNNNKYIRIIFEDGGVIEGIISNEHYDWVMKNKDRDVVMKGEENNERKEEVDISSEGLQGDIED